jgi:hypothetical protein
MNSALKKTTVTGTTTTVTGLTTSTQLFFYVVAKMLLEILRLQVM